MTKKQKMIGLVVALIAVVAVGVTVFVSNKNSNEVADSSNTSSSSNTPPPVAETQPPSPEGSVNPPPAGSSPDLSYDAAVKKYGTNRIQFDSTCQARPFNVTFKSGTDVMFDNRANVKRKIVFNGKTYNIAAYGYAVVKMTAAKYPTTALVDCDGSQNVATVLIQK